MINDEFEKKLIQNGFLMLVTETLANTWQEERILPIIADFLAINIKKGLGFSHVAIAMAAKKGLSSNKNATYYKVSRELNDYIFIN